MPLTIPEPASLGRASNQAIKDREDSPTVSSSASGEATISASPADGVGSTHGEIRTPATDADRRASGSGARKRRSLPGSNLPAQPVAQGFDRRWIAGGAAVAVVAAVMLFGGGRDEGGEGDPPAAAAVSAPEEALPDPIPAAPTPQDTPAAPVAEPVDPPADAPPNDSVIPDPAGAQATAEDPKPQGPPEAPAGLPALADVRSGGEAADLLSQAQAALQAGDAAKAYALAEQSYGLRRRNEAVKVMALAGCIQGDGLVARSAYRKLVGGSERNAVQGFCKDRGVEVLSSVSGFTADELLTQAQIAADEGRHGDAYRLAKQANRQRHSAKTLQFMGVEACKWKRAEKVTVVLGMLRPDMRIPVERACADAGVTLP